MDDDLFDFGFTTVDIDESPEIVQKVNDALNTQERLDKMYSAIQPLLSNLKKNPEKEYIHWPDRVHKVEQFEYMLKNIYNPAP